MSAVAQGNRISARHTVIPKMDIEMASRANGDVITSKMTEADWAKYGPYTPRNQAGKNPTKYSLYKDKHIEMAKKRKAK